MSRFGHLEFNKAAREQDSTTTPSFSEESHLLALAQAAFERAEFEPALRHYSKVMEYNPGSSMAWAGQVRALIELEQFEEARKWGDRALERFEQDPELQAAKAVVLARTGDLEAALMFSDASMEHASDTPYVWLARADVLLSRGEDHAGYCFEKAFAFAHQDWFITWLAARIRFFHGQFTQCIRLMKSVLAINAEQSHLWLLLASCQKEVGLLTPARTSLQQARELSPRNREILVAIQDLERPGLQRSVRAWFRRLTQKQS